MHFEESPNEKTGVRAGDIILQLKDQPQLIMVYRQVDGIFQRLRFDDGDDKHWTFLIDTEETFFQFVYLFAALLRMDTVDAIKEGIFNNPLAGCAYQLVSLD